MRKDHGFFDTLLPGCQGVSLGYSSNDGPGLRGTVFPPLLPDLPFTARELKFIIDACLTIFCFGEATTANMGLE